jgi:hypothetical protein
MHVSGLLPSLASYVEHHAHCVAFSNPELITLAIDAVFRRPVNAEHLMILLEKISLYGRFKPNHLHAVIEVRHARGFTLRTAELRRRVVV